jgi:phosphoglycerate dehydrogenase-like enzyme
MNAMPELVVAIDDGYASYDQEEALLGAMGARFELRPVRASEAAAIEAVRDASVVLVREVSSQAAALALALNRRLLLHDRETRAGRWSTGVLQPMVRLRGRTLGLVGYGRIARMTHEKLVFETEPPDPAHPIFQLANAIVTNHIGWYSEEAMRELQRKAAEEAVRVLQGEAPRHWLNRW